MTLDGQFHVWQAGNLKQEVGWSLSPCICLFHAIVEAFSHRLLLVPSIRGEALCLDVRTALSSIQVSFRSCMSPHPSFDVPEEKNRFPSFALGASPRRASSVESSEGRTLWTSNLRKAESAIPAADSGYLSLDDVPSRVTLGHIESFHQCSIDSSHSVMPAAAVPPHHDATIQSGELVESAATSKSALRSRRKSGNVTERSSVRNRFDQQIIAEEDVTMEEISVGTQDLAQNERDNRQLSKGERKGIQNDVNDCFACDACFPGGKFTIVPLMDSRDYTEVPPKERDYTGSMQSRNSRSGSHSLISWLRSKKKYNASKQDIAVASQQNKDIGAENQSSLMLSQVDSKLEEKIVPVDNHNSMQMEMESMKEELSQANKNKDEALAEVSELKKAIEDMGRKLGQLEDHYKCFDFPPKRIDNLASIENAGARKFERDDDDVFEHPRMSSSRGSAMALGAGPTKREFCHAVVEARVGVKQFCRTLLQQLRDKCALDKIDLMLKAQNFKVNVSVKGGTVSKRVKYLVESLVNQAFYEDFENIKFTKNGSYCVLDPRQRPIAFFKTYMGISQVGWSELVNKESSAYSAGFDGFCDRKMNKIAEELLFFWDLEGGWPDELVEAFFVAGKWVWLLHLLAFSFEHPATIFRVSSESHFDNLYMEELPSKDPSAKEGIISRHPERRFGFSNMSEMEDSPTILAMVMPGFFFNSYEVIRCKVLLAGKVR